MSSVTDNATTLAELQEQLKVLQKEGVDLAKTYARISGLRNDNVNKQRETQLQIKRLEEIIESGNAFHVFTNYAEAASLLPDEKQAIWLGMDKTDYHLKDIRYHDLERIIKEVVQLKSNYGSWTLVKVEEALSQDSLPPHIHYKYTFKTGNPIGQYMSCVL